MTTYISDKLKQFTISLRWVDGFYMRFFIVFLALAFPVRITEKFVFGKDYSKMAFLLFLIFSTFLTLLWIKLDTKVSPSLFSGYVPRGTKNSALIKRGIFLLILIQMCKGLEGKAGNVSGILGFFSYHLSNAYVNAGIIVMIIAIIMIVFRPTKRRNLH